MIIQYFCIISVFFHKKVSINNILQSISNFYFINTCDFLVYKNRGFRKLKYLRGWGWGWGWGWES